MMSEFPEDCPLSQSPLDLTRTSLSGPRLPSGPGLSDWPFLFCFQLLPSPVITVLDLIGLKVYPLDFAYGFLQLAALSLSVPSAVS